MCSDMKAVGVCLSCRFAMMAASSGFRFSSPCLRVMSATTPELWDYRSTGHLWDHRTALILDSETWSQRTM